MGRLEGDDEGIRGHEGVHGQLPDRGWVIDQDDVVGSIPQGATQPRVAADRGRQVEIRRGQPQVGSQDCELRARDDDRLRERQTVEQDLLHARLSPDRDAELARQRPLGVDIDREDVEPPLGERHRQVEHRGRLGAATLRIGDRDRHRSGHHPLPQALSCHVPWRESRVFAAMAAPGSRRGSVGWLRE